jgi:hypothetical protein
MFYKNQTMKNLYIFSKSLGRLASILVPVLFVIGMFGSTSEVLAQCTNTSSYGSAVAPTGTAVTTISTCSYQTEYSTISSVVAGNRYVVTNNAAAGAFITIHFSTYNGTVVAAGFSPLQFTAPCAGTYYAHWNTNAACGTATGCTTTTISCVSCGATNGNQCTNTSSYGSATAPTSGSVNFSTCSYASEYSTLNSVVAGTVYRCSSSVATDFITIRQGSSSGPVIASGKGPLTWTSTVAGTYYCHWSASSTCATASGCRTTSIAYVSVGPCSGCSGTPTPGNTLATLAAVPVGGTTVLSMQNATGTGALYQWQSAPTSTGPWTNITGATAATYTLTFSTPTWYRCSVTCTVYNGTSTPIQIVQGPCVPTSTYGSASGYYGVISNVTFNTMNHTSAGLAAPWFASYPTSVATTSVMTGTTQNLSITSYYYDIVGVWFDWNNNMIYESTEYVAISPNSNSAGVAWTGTASVFIPTNATIGTISMRVRTNYYGYALGAADACTSTYYGETKDYRITVIAAPDCSGTPNASTAVSSVTNGCDGSPFTLSATGFSVGTGITYQWQSAPTATGPWTNITGATTTTYNTATSTTAYYRMVTTCAFSATSNFSNVVSYTVQSCCAYTFLLTDSFGDGWNGATMQVRQGTTVIATLGGAFTTGTSFTVNLPLANGVAYNLFYAGSGSYPSEVGIQVLSPTGLNLYTATAGSAVAGTQLTSWTATCPVPCTGTPAPGATTSTSTYVTSSEFFTLGLQNTPTTTGNTYIWQSSTNGTTWPVVNQLINTNFSALPANGAVFGTASVTGGELILTNNVGSSVGGFVVNTLPGTNTNSFVANFDYRMFDGGGADGMSLSYGPDVNAATAGGGEAGEGTGVIVSFDSYYNAGGYSSSQVFVFYNGVQIYANTVGSYNLRNAAYRNANINVNEAGQLSVSIAGAGVVSGVQLPAAYLSANKSAWRFKLSARTGGVADKHSVDNLSITMGAIGVGATLTTSEAGATYYQCVVLCTGSGASATSTPILVNYNPFCTPLYTYGVQYGDLISNVAIPTTTLNNYSGIATTGPSYTYYSAITPPILQASTSYQIQVTAGSFTNQNFAVWIDYNDNGAFEASEKVGFTTAATTAAYQMVSFQINLACTPPLGIHRMRVRGVYATAGSTIDPCASYYYGETEDYNVNVVAGAPFTPSFITPPSASACTLTDYTYTTQAGMQNYTWVIPGVAGVDYMIVSGGTTTSNTLVINWLTGGTKTVSINYLNASGCTSTGPVTNTVTVQSTIAITPITGIQSVCAGSQVTFSTPTAGGTWSSSNTAVATINPTTGVVTGVSAGTATMTYSVPNPGTWCPPSTATRAITVLPVPIVNAGPDVSICAGASTPMNGSVVFNTSCNQTITLYDSFGDGWNGCTATVLVAGVPVLSNITLATGAGPLSYSFSATNGQAIQVTFTAASWPNEPYFTITNGAGTNLVSNYFPYTSGTWNGVASGCPSITPVWTPSTGLSATNILNPIANPSSTQVYTMSATASNGCTISDQVQVTVQPLPVVSIANQTVATFCNGGSVVLAPTPTAQNYAWSQGATAVGTGSTYTATTSGNYSLVVTNYYPASGISCSSLPSNPITVTVNPNPNTAITPSGATSICQGSSVTLNAGATNSTPVTYLWSNGATTSSIVATASGSPTVAITNNFGCTTTSAPTTVTVLPLPVATITAGGSTTFCAGGTVALNASAGSTYLWSPGGATTQTLNATTAGNYSVTVSGANGCSATSTPIAVNVLAAPANAPIAGPASLCVGNSIALTNPVSNGVWSSSNTSVLNVNASTGAGVGNGIGTATITYTTTGANGCTSAQTTSVSVTGSPVASISASGATAICQGGTVTLTANPAQSYLWNNNATTQSITVSNGGAYSVVISNGPGCSSAASAPTTVTVNPLPVAAITANGSTVFCQGGSVNLTATGGTTYVWNNNATGATLNASTAGNYSVTVTNANGCTATSNSIAVSVNALPTASITANGPTTFCQGANVVLTATGNGSIAWTNNQNTPAITVAASGNYAYTITDANGCTATSTPTTVTVTALPVVPSITGANNVCAGASTLFANTMTGGTWSSSNGSIASVDALGSVTGAGVGSATISYQVTQNGCSATSTKVINVQAAPVATISALGSTSFCIGSNVTLVSSPGVTYAWSNGATSQNVTLNTAGPITVQVTGTNGCSATSAPQTITVNALPVLDPIAGASVVCVGSNGTLTNTTGGGSWSSANANIATVNAATGVVSGNAAGTANMTYTYTNANGCTNAVSAPVVIQALPSAATTVAGSTVFCQGGSVTLTAPTAASYLWIPGGATTQSIAATAGGSYTVQVSNGACSATSPATIVTVHALPTASITSTATAICQGGTVTLTAAPATSYAWSNGATTQSITVTAAGNYGVTVSNVYGCTSTSAPTAISVSALPSSYISAAGPTTFCNGSSVVLSANPGASYVWSNGATTQNITANATGNYFVTITNAAGCSSVSNEIQVNAQQTFTATATAVGPTAVCDGAFVTLVASPGASYLWSNGATTQGINAGVNGNYSVTVTNALGCSSTSTNIPVTVLPVPTAGITAGGATTFCEGGSVVLTGTGGNTYVWNNSINGSTITATQGGTYIVTAYAANGCSDAAEVTVTVNEVPSSTLILDGNAVLCPGESLVISAQPNNTYAWSNNATTQSITVTTPGTYSAVLTGLNGCTSNSDVVTVTAGAATSSTINATGYSSYTLNEVVYTQSGTYTQTLTNAAGCDSTITLNLTLTVGIEEGNITDVNLYPNPTSESFTIKTSAPLYGTYSIVDAQGKLVFSGEMTGTDTHVNISSVARGIYYLRIPELSEPLRVVKN